jgi:hypothetical protein
MTSSRSKKPKRTGSMALFADVLPVLYKDLKLDKKVNEFAFLALWPQAVTAVLGVEIAMQTQATRLRRQAGKTTLYAKVSSAALASELGFYTTALQKTLNAYAPQTGITIQRIQLQVGSLNKA